MQGKIRILESDNEELVKEKKLFNDANIHFSGHNSHIITHKKENYHLQIDFITVEAESLQFEGELKLLNEEKSSNVVLRFTPTPFLKMN